MDRFEEVLRLKEIGDTVKRLVVDQYSAEQCLLASMLCGAVRNVGSAGACLRAVESNTGMVAVEESHAMADLRRIRNAARGSVYGFTLHRGSLNDRRTRRIGNSCTQPRTCRR